MLHQIAKSNKNAYEQCYIKLTKYDESLYKLYNDSIRFKCQI